MYFIMTLAVKTHDLKKGVHINYRFLSKKEQNALYIDDIKLLVNMYVIENQCCLILS